MSRLMLPPMNDSEVTRGRTVYRARPALRSMRERGDHPMSLRTMAQKAGLSAAHLARIEVGERHASPNTAINISKALGVERSKLFDPIVTN